jgi:hypothetical protein
MATFKYNSALADRLYATDETSVIYLDNGTLLASQNCRLSGASLVTSGLSTLRGDATLDLNGLWNMSVAGSTIRTGDVIIPAMTSF